MLVERAVAEFGRLDILVNNAAFQMTRGGIQEISSEEFDRTFRTNVYAMFYLSKAALSTRPLTRRRPHEPCERLDRGENTLMKQVTIPHVMRAAIFASLLCAAGSAQEGQTTPEAGGQQAGGQSVPKVEVGAQYSQFGFPGLSGFPDFFRPSRPSPGVGARVSYNLTDHLSVEAEANLFPFEVDRGNIITTEESLVAGGRPFQAQFGVKAGKRFRRFGLFAKARPGLVSFGEALTVRTGAPTFVLGGQQFFALEIFNERKTHFSLDVGGVVEVYASRRVFARFDAGDTMIRYGSHRGVAPSFPPGDRTLEVRPRTRHNLQFGAGVGVRLGALGGGDGEGRAAAIAPRERPPGAATRFEAGAQFTSLSFSEVRALGDILGTGTRRTETEFGFGGRFTLNLTPYLAAEAEANLLPRKLSPAFDTGVAGRATQVQFGFKAGRRFRSFGLFAKARPGVVSFDSSLKLLGTRTRDFIGLTLTEGVFEVRRRTFFSADVGGVVELYPSRRWLLRFDAGDTVIRYRSRHFPNPFINPAIQSMPAETRHNLQLSTGVGFRF